MRDALVRVLRAAEKKTLLTDMGGWPDGDARALTDLLAGGYVRAKLADEATDDALELTDEGRAYLAQITGAVNGG